MNTNDHSPTDICQSMIRMFLIDKDQVDYDKEFNLRLICAEAYQTIGDTDQAYCQYNEAEIIEKKLDETETILNSDEPSERNRKRKKLEEIGMKLEFQSQFKINLRKNQKRHIYSRSLRSL